jgi:dienelactone hydrolase
MSWVRYGGVLALCVCAVAAVAHARSAGAPSAAARPTELLLRIPLAGTPNGMLTRLCFAKGSGPAPLAIINHGSPPVAKDRLTRKVSTCGEVAQFFNARGYTVAFPLRRGYGETGGEWAETYGKCDHADFVAGGQATADDITAALAFLLRRDDIAKGRTLIIGQSAGGWGTLAFASRNPEGVVTFINFAGGRGAHKNGLPNNNCSPDALVAAASRFGKTTPRPTLWVYTENDTLIYKALSGRLHAAYQAAGGQAHYELLPPFGTEGHNLFFGKGGSKIWGPIVDRWLASANG